MIGLDTNLLVRFFMQDDARQNVRVGAVMRSLSTEEPGWVGLAVVLELAWVLSGTYHISRAEFTHILNHLLSRKEILVEKVEVVHHAIRIYRATNVGFADCLISASASAAGCAKTLTFDQDAAKSAGMTLVP